MSPPLQFLYTRWPLVLVLVGLSLVGVLLYGCDTRREIVLEGVENDARDVCESLLDSGLDMARPVSLGLIGIDATLRNTPEEAADQLDQWLRRDDCRAASPAEPMTAGDRALLTRLLGEEGLKQALSEQVDAFDAAHLRDTLLDYTAADSLVRDSEDDLDRVMRLFVEVVRGVARRGESTTDIPLTTYESRLFGSGTPEHRAWLFANLLRQLRIDAVVIRPSGSGGAGDGWWVGVIQEDGVYLFDLTLGLPVPADDSLLPPPIALPKPATWSQVVETPELLVNYRREAGLEPAAITAENVRSPRIELIGPRSFWSVAMERLELSMSSDRGVLLYDPLQDTQAGHGLVRRVIAAGRSQWTEDSLSIWPYPDRLRELRASLTDPQRQRLEQRLQPYLGPVEVDSKTGAIGPHRELWQARIEHLSGHPAAAIGNYLRVRLARLPNPDFSPAQLSLNRQAADEASYWSAHAQIGASDYNAAIETIDDYLDQQGDRRDEARALRVLALASAGRLADAAEAVSELPATTPDLARLRWLASRWSGNAAASE